MPNVVGDSNNPNVAAVFGNNTGGGQGVSGRSNTQAGVVGISEQFVGVWGESLGSDANGRYHPAVLGTSVSSEAVVGDSRFNTGVRGTSVNGSGVVGESTGRGSGVIAVSVSPDSAALYVRNNVNMDTIGDKHIIEGVNKAGLAVFRVNVHGDVVARNYTPLSDKNTKENFSDVNTLEILGKLVSMQIQSWNYKEDSSDKRHIGPTAQDFHAAFGLNGDDNRLISSIDLQGVALAAIQGLNEKNEKLKAENAELHANFS
ncbi:tail fiber domain-containing protein [Brevibacillus laterosporus]|uniref:tail fiber domain-containing protein n=1 Tax=Brevibacillus laterosporus TaxID=1465 RepID=UPI000EAB9C31|nr:tail fiber domain-containing protein [Brevibacillus laterosporus]AYK08634.1 tail fiber domain-containing protein [Brevibacillus laterosporus]